MTLDNLNPSQRQAVEAYEGPVLVLAGAGSGKTRVITYRIAYLLQQRLARPWEIVAMTFTNKAAAEMRERVQTLLGGNLGELYVGTFHAFGARFLRRHADAFKRTPRFTIYDEDDQSRLIRNLLKQNFSDDRSKGYFQAVRQFIEKAKGNLKMPEMIAAEVTQPIGKHILDLYYKYEAELASSNAFDFDDLVVLPCRLLLKDAQLRNTAGAFVFC